MKTFISCFIIAIYYLPLAGQVAISCNDFVEKCKTIVEVLCSDSLQGRRAGTLGDFKTQQYLTKLLKNTRAKPFNQQTYIQQFSYVRNGDSVITANIVFEINQQAKKYILFTAHFDHLGIGCEKSRSFFKKAIHPGANDNASGVALLVLLAEHLSLKKNLKYWKNKANFVFAFLSGHEDGLYGSKYFISTLPSSVSSNILIVINFDMIGKLQEEQGIIIYDPLKTLTRKTDTVCPNKVVVASEDTYNDHNPFVHNQISAITITTGMYDDYHQISDTPEKLNYKGLYSIYNFITTFFLQSLIYY